MNKALAILGIILLLVGIIDGAINWAGSAATNLVNNATNSTFHVQAPNPWTSLMTLDVILVLVGVVLVVISLFIN